MHGERPDHTLQPTVLVHEAFLRLVGDNRGDWTESKHFFAVAATMMRRILIDHARQVRAQKRGGGGKISLDAADAITPAMSEELVALDEALTRLAKLDPRQSQVVELRFFAGLSEEEIAKILFGVDLVITGSVQRSAGGARLIVNIIDARRLRQLRSSDSFMEQTDAAAIERGIVAQVTNLLDIELRPGRRPLQPVSRERERPGSPQGC